MWIKIIITIVVGLLLYTNTSEQQKQDFKDSASSIWDNIKELQNSTEVSSNSSGDEETSLTLLGMPHKEIEFECEKNRDCLEYGDNVICEEGKCYEK